MSIEKILYKLDQNDTVARIWRRDSGVWGGGGAEQDEIITRLGWLTSPSDIGTVLRELEILRDKLLDEGVCYVVLLGMGGSSLCPEVLRTSIGGKDCCPELIVLDSTVPGTITAVEQSIELADTIFLVSSKSGTTTEMYSLYRRFRSLMDRCVGATAGRHFIAITDLGSPLEAIAQREGFRKVFYSDPDVGGRYSVFTHFGIVPAALIGLDLDALVSRGQEAMACSGPGIPLVDNPGAYLGAELGAHYQMGRDKLTFVTSPKLASFQLWAEQLLAESTGKDSQGILPIVGEPMVDAEFYGADRVFIYVRMNDDNNMAADDHVNRLKEAGFCVIERSLNDIYDLGFEFYVWEFATAVAGAVLGVNPFNQPNVQQSKDATTHVLEAYIDSGILPEVRGISFEDLLERTPSGGYLAIMAYLHQTQMIDDAVAVLRRSILERRRIPTTFGYGPRFLHSTGQLHKGGKPNGVFLQLVSEDSGVKPIPGRAYDFKVLVAAQALGDMEALASRKLPTSQVTLGADAADQINKLVRLV